MRDWWTGWPWRLIQTNLRETDMRDIDARRVVADLRSFHANVLMINAAGIIASYPTRLPFHFQSPYLTGDSLETIIAACHDADIRVIARTDFSKVRRPIHERHPQWAYRTAGGDIVDYNGDVHVCVNGGYQQEAALRIIDECLSTHAFDGIFFNMGGYVTRDYSGRYYGPCHCDNCRRLFAEAHGLPLPTKEDLEDPAYRAYVRFKRDTVREHQEKVYRFIQSVRPDVCVANHLPAGRGFIRQESNTAVDRPLPHWQYDASDNTKWAACGHPGMVSSNTTVDFIDFPYRHVAVSPHQQTLRLAQSMANGGALDYYLIGRLDDHADRSGFQPVRSVFAYHAAHASEYAGLRSMAHVLLLTGPNANAAEYRGWFRALVEHHFLFDVLTANAATGISWDKYRAVIVPDLQGIGDALAAHVDGFVQRGGALVATGRAGFRDENFDPRPAPALRSPGIEGVRAVRTDTRSTYVTLVGEDRARWPRLSDSDLVYVDGPYVDADYAADAVPCLKTIPPHHFGPPERCYYGAASDDPGFVTRTAGGGVAVYVPWLPGALFHRQGHTNTSAFMADLLEHVAGARPVGGNLSPMVEVTRHEQAGGAGQLIHLVNTSGHFGNSFHAPVPMHDLEVSVDLPRAPSAVRLLAAGADCPHAWVDGVLTVRVPRLDAFEAVAVRTQ